jgi:hypothetical protein
MMRVLQRRDAQPMAAQQGQNRRHQRGLAAAAAPGKAQHARHAAVLSSITPGIARHICWFPSGVAETAALAFMSGPAFQEKRHHLRLRHRLFSYRGMSRPSAEQELYHARARKCPDKLNYPAGTAWHEMGERNFQRRPLIAAQPDCTIRCAVRIRRQTD